MSTAYPVVGIADGDGVQPRLELNDLIAKPIQFSLFIRALTNIMKMNSADPSSPNYRNKPNSWWQIGAIHGLPYIPWSGDPNSPPQPDPNSNWQGYCYHSSALFPTWHRSLLLLVEQAVVNEAIEIATGLEENNPTAKKEQWLQAARSLRYPYWDWTKPPTAEVGIPLVCQNPKVNIAIPGGTNEQVDNPLNHYEFAGEPGSVQGFEYMANWSRTYRWANQNENPTVEMYDEALKAFSVGSTLNLGGREIILRPVSWLRGKVSSLFTYDLALNDASYGPNMWGYFSNTGSKNIPIYAPMPVMPSSLEEPHNMVHLDTGGNGSMAMNEYAGFDPIFFLHHCNVDRLYAFWEYLYPKYWIESGWNDGSGQTVPFTTTQGNYQQDADTEVDHATALDPFPKADLTYWTSDDTRSLLPSAFNKFYTYPPITDPQTGVQVKVDVPYDETNLSLREQYQQILINEWSGDLSSVVQSHQAVSLAENAKLSPHVNLLLKQDNDSAHLRQFVATGHLPEFAFAGSHRLELYIAPKQPQEQPLVVNNISVLERGNPENCPSCKDRRAAGNHIRGYMSLDPHVVLYLLSQLDATQLSNITTLDDVAAVIQGSLGMRIVQPDGTTLAVSDVDPHIGPTSGPLEAAKAPRVALHSHVVSFNSKDASVIRKRHSHVTHGDIGDKGGWKAL